MGNLGQTIKRFVGNKNTVTILAVIAGILVLWYFYNYRVDEAISVVQVPYAVERIDTAKKIESENIEYREINKTALQDNDIVTDDSFLEGKYICYGTSIPANGFFYSSQICDEKELPNSVIENIGDDEKVYALNVSVESTYANSIMPGDYIDLYLKAQDDNGRILFGPLVESIQVLAVRDSSGLDLFWNSNAGDTAFLLFAVKDEYYRLLNIAGELSINIFPVPRSSSYTQNPGETRIGYEELKNFIMSRSAAIADE